MASTSNALYSCGGAVNAMTNLAHNLVTICLLSLVIQSEELQWPPTSGQHRSEHLYMCSGASILLVVSRWCTLNTPISSAHSCVSELC